MGYTLVIADSDEIDDDLVRIVRFLNQRDVDLGSDFMVAVEDTLERMEERLKQKTQVVSALKFGRFHSEPIVSRKNSPAYAKKFPKYHIWYVVEEEREELIVLAIEYAAKDPSYLRRLLMGRSKKG